MLVLSRKLNQTIVINGNIRITVVGLRGNHVRLGIEAPASVGILRHELCEHAAKTDREAALAATSSTSASDECCHV
jgi:carbon storage regulator